MNHVSIDCLSGARLAPSRAGPAGRLPAIPNFAPSSCALPAVSQGSPWPCRRVPEYRPSAIKPVFGDRDKSLHDDVNDLSLERRNGYAW